MTTIATSTIYQSITSSLLSAETNQATAGQQVSSGMLGNTLSAFGSQTEALVAAQAVQVGVNGMVSQLNQTSTQLTFQQSALNQVSSIAQQLQTALTNAEGANTGDGLMSQVQSLFSQAQSALNTQYNGQYIFSGGATSTQPFTAATLSDLTTQPSVSSFFQNGSLVPVSSVDTNATIQTGFLASDVGQSLMSAFQSIQAFQQSASGSFGGNLTSAQQSFLSTAVSQLDSVVASTTQTTAQGGNIQNQVQTALTTQTDRQTTLQQVIGNMSNADAAAAASNLVQAQTAFQAAAQVFTSLKSMSLLNYLSSSTPVA
jgi:flagellar hook-associated protein 3 FlgL